MTTRRDFLTIASAAAASAALPAPALAYTPPKHLLPTEVRISSRFQPGEIVILPRAYYLYYVTAPNAAIRYGIAVAKPGLGYTGTATIKRKVKWPTWRPTDDMIERDPGLYGKYRDNEDRMPGGPGNPLGARALYLFEGNRDTLIRIHGTVEPRSIGRRASSGCFRMINDHVIDLYNRVEIGTPVTVLQ
ncbi:ErfK/YbiS/YcfS/YnhG family protein/Tat domain protein [Pseudooceanicola batsensis HTCC2597]|uniref:ErfK/YbiS/YcfS/YnhG family protein/Tat domain protein n=1 Tax=Pseudooceanicola batsensis (strain ATCC BAA-863 / DSM 15984 / KCTC 12145 / HTCC2597) TaxID=252305 RepID=A3U2D8_PSEBH|nr:L,D-transpeptidase [Pseudooceanicola batsensis]EAQ01738.1 ErfK/YbiS/YcfS/YnhG family protein/Tat domain protein [Pseudooceanicola batsensis HTCC2597]